MNEDLNPAEAEDIVIGQVLYEPGCISRAARILKAEHFFGDAHRTTFAAAMDLWREGTPVDTITMVTAMRKAGTLDRVGGAYWLSTRTNRVAQTIHLEHHAAIVRDYYGLRILREGGKTLYAGANVSADPEALISSLNAEVGKAVGADLDTDVNAGERAYALLNEPNRPRPYYLGMDAVDQLVFIRPGNVVTVSAHSGVGKTAFVLCAVINLIDTLKPWFVSLEMPADELITRALCQLAQVDMQDAMEDRLGPSERQRMAEASNTHSARLSRLDIDDSGSMTIDAFMAKAEHKVRNEGAGIIVVDYAQLMEADRKTYGNEALQNEAISKGIRATARRLEVPIMLVVHLNRLGEAHGSTQYEKDAHIRIKLSREPGAPVMDVDVVKNRNGRTAKVATPCDLRFGLIGRHIGPLPTKPNFPHPDDRIEPNF